jgi:hypothetical protein
MLSFSGLMTGLALPILAMLVLAMGSAFSEHHNWQPVASLQAADNGAVFTSFGQVVGGVLLVILGGFMSARHHLETVKRSIQEALGCLSRDPDSKEIERMSESSSHDKDVENSLHAIAKEVDGLDYPSLWRMKELVLRSQFSARDARESFEAVMALLREDKLLKVQRTRLLIALHSLYLVHLRKRGDATRQCAELLKARGSACAGVLIGVTACCYWPDPLAYKMLREFNDVSFTQEMPVAFTGAVVITFMIIVGLASLSVGHHLWDALNQREETAWL